MKITYFTNASTTEFAERNETADSVVTCGTISNLDLTGLKEITLEARGEFEKKVKNKIAKLDTDVNTSAPKSDPTKTPPGQSK